MKRVYMLCCIAVFALASYSVFAQSIDPDSVFKRREELQKELQELETQIADYQNVIIQKQEEAASLERDIALLNAEIQRAKLEIRAREIVITNLRVEIEGKSKTIDEILERINGDKMVLADTLRHLSEFDDFSLLEVILSYNKLSDFFNDTQSLDALQREIQDAFRDLRNTRKQEEEAIVELEEKRREQLELKTLQEIQQQKLKQKESEKRQLLDVTKGVESAYHKLVSFKKSDAAKIRSELFLLAGSPAIPFEKALELANRAFEKTDVRPAFLLGIITQETELGKNIGQCNLPDDPPKFKWFNIMKSTRDQEPYLNITSRLGLDPNSMPLSCPQAGGWGGAMGPSQFIPSTWLQFEKRIAKATSHNPPNPWDPEDAFMASAIYLSDLGADKGTYNAEWEAAMRYFAGSRWRRNSLRFYGDNVMSLASKYQEQINILSSVSLR